MMTYEQNPFQTQKEKSRPTIQQIKIKDGLDAKQLLWDGLKAYEGESAVWKPEYDEVVEWLKDNHHKGLMLAGNCGQGKTLLAMHILPVIFQNYCEENKDFYSGGLGDIEVYSAYEMNEIYRREENDNNWGNRKKSRKDLFGKSPIMIDDFGTETELNIFGEKHMVFSEIVDHAEKNGRMLILTTNLTSDQIQAHYDMRIRDRLRYLVKRIGFDGKSLRK